MLKKRRGRAGNTIPKAAEKLQMGEGQLRRAIDRGEVKYVEFAGLRRIPDAEIERIADLLGLSISEPVEACPAEGEVKAKAKAKAAKSAKSEQANA